MFSSKNTQKCLKYFSNIVNVFKISQYACQVKVKYYYILNNCFFHFIYFKMCFSLRLLSNNYLMNRKFKRTAFI